MVIYVDYVGRRILREEDVLTPEKNLSFAQNDLFDLTIILLDRTGDSDAPLERMLLPTGYTGISVTGRRSAYLESAALFTATDFEATSVSGTHTGYVGELSLRTASLATALTGLPTLDAVLDIELTDGEEDGNRMTVVSSFPIRVNRDVHRGTEVVELVPSATIPISNVEGLQDALDEMGGGDMTGAEILAALLPVDGAGTGLDADLLDGLNSTAFLRVANNLSDLDNPATARTHLGLGTAATTAATDYATDEQGDLADTALQPSALDLWLVGDGTSTPVSEWLAGGLRDRGYANLAAIQVDYPSVQATTDQIDWAVIQNVFDEIGAGTQTDTKTVTLPVGVFMLTRELEMKGEGVELVGQGAKSSMLVCMNDTHGILMGHDDAGEAPYRQKVRNVGLYSSADLDTSTKIGILAGTTDESENYDTWGIQIDSCYVEGFHIGVAAHNAPDFVLSNTSIVGCNIGFDAGKADTFLATSNVIGNFAGHFSGVNTTAKCLCYRIRGALKGIAWVTATAYTAGNVRSVNFVSYRCTVGHTSGALTEPGVGAAWAGFWELVGSPGGPNFAGTIIGGDYNGGVANSAFLAVDDGCQVNVSSLNTETFYGADGTERWNSFSTDTYGATTSISGGWCVLLRRGRINIRQIRMQNHTGAIWLLSYPLANLTNDIVAESIDIAGTSPLAIVSKGDYGFNTSVWAPNQIVTYQDSSGTSLGAMPITNSYIRSKPITWDSNYNPNVSASMLAIRLQPFFRPIRPGTDISPDRFVLPYMRQDQTGARSDLMNVIHSKVLLEEFTNNANVTTTPKVLFTVATIADELWTIGRHITVEASGNFADNYNAKTLQLIYPSAQVIFTTGANTVTGIHWHLRTVIHRKEFNNFATFTVFSMDGLPPLVYSGNKTSESVTDAGVLQLVGTGVASNDIIIRTAKVTIDE